MGPKKLKGIRRDINMSQWKLSQLSGVSRFRISMYESKYIKLKRQEKIAIAKALDSQGAERIKNETD